MTARKVLARMTGAAGLAGWIFLSHTRVQWLGRAIPLYEATMADRERVLGMNHPNTLASR